MTQEIETVSQSKRYWKRSDEPAGWWPWGLLWLAGLILIYLIGALITAPNIESRTTASVGEALADYNIESIDVDGQHVQVVANADTNDRENILARAKAAACQTWAGDLTCPVHVALQLKAAAPVAAIEEAPKSTDRLHDFMVRKSVDTWVVSGEFPTNDARQDFLSNLDTKERTLSDDTTVSGDRSTAADSEASARAQRLLPLLNGGQVIWNNGEFSVRGLVAAENEQPVRDLFNAQTPTLGLGTITLQIAEETERCNESFAELLNTTSIRFRTGSANIDNKSQALLVALAEIANDCDGDLRIDGHTDDVGSDENNQVLSQKRADAVASALTGLGVEAARLTATGYGESRPVGDNATEAGRARNRRIVIRIAELN